MAGRSLGVVEEKGRSAAPPDGVGEGGLEAWADRLVALGRALSDPIRVRMLGMMAATARGGRGCCELPDLGAPAGEEDQGICVCEFQDRFGMGQSKVSYHMRKLKDAGLVREEKRGRWSFYSLDGGTAEGLLRETADWLLPGDAGQGHGGTRERAS